PWPAPANPGAPTYYPATTRAGTFTASGVSHDDFLTGIYHNGSGSGRITYIGGHSFATAVPYSTNAEAPFLRAFYNSLLFNGAGEARLDLSLESDSYPQNGTGLLNLSIKNTGGTTADNVSSLGVTLAPGITYVGTTTGPAPNVSGQTLVWPGGVAVARRTDRDPRHADERALEHGNDCGEHAFGGHDHHHRPCRPDHEWDGDAAHPDLHEQCHAQRERCRSLMVGERERDG